jgi:hypothetical protein
MIYIELAHLLGEVEVILRSDFHSLRRRIVLWEGGRRTCSSSSEFDSPSHGFIPSSSLKCVAPRMGVLA